MPLEILNRKSGAPAKPATAPVAAPSFALPEEVVAGDYQLNMIVRAVVGWGGRGVRGDTDRIGARIIGGLLTNILANQFAMGLAAVDRLVLAAGRGGLVCAHCGFASGHERAFSCPKCGMRLLRS